MEFQRIQIDGFGTLADQHIDDLSSGLNVYYGANGSGKTTILHFLRGVFCGFDEARRLNLSPPIKGGAPGGSLTLTDGASQFTVIRRGRTDHADALAIQVRSEAQSKRKLCELGSNTSTAIWSIFCISSGAMRLIPSAASCISLFEMELISPRHVVMPRGLNPSLNPWTVDAALYGMDPLRHD